MLIKVKRISWNEFDERCVELAIRIKKNKKIKSIYGIPRGGLIPAVRLSHLTDLPLTGDPKTDSTLIVDEVNDTGSTKNSFRNFKYYEVLIDKKKEGITEWLQFPWEVKDESK